MKKFKIVLWVILIALLVTIFFQNKLFLMGKQAFVLNLLLGGEMQSAPLPIFLWFLIALCFGFLVAYFSALIKNFKMGRMLKAMKAQSDTQAEMITQLKNELESHTGPARPPTEGVLNVEPVTENNPQAPEKILMRPEE
jgi:hypothetical protein